SLSLFCFDDSSPTCLYTLSLHDALPILVTLLTGYGSLAFMWFENTLTLQALLASTALFVVGAIFGWAHVCYERYLVRTCPEYLADRKSTRLNSSHVSISYAVFCLKKKMI